MVCILLRWSLLVLILALLGACNSSSSTATPETTTRVALLFVGHGEPAVFEDGDVPITLADGSMFGPHAESLGVPVEFQNTEWAAAYEEIATALTYIFGDVNGNGTEHEIAISPAGDVPPFFTWDAFHADIERRYQAFGNYSPHNTTMLEHVQSIDLQIEGVQIDTHMAYLDAVPRISDVVWDMTQTGDYDKLVVVPMLLADSTHTQEVAEQVHAVTDYTTGMTVVVSDPFFEIPYMRERLASAVVAMASHIRNSIPESVSDEEIGVLLASHGTPYTPASSEFGWQPGDIYSELIPTEDAFHAAVAEQLPWQSRTGRMNYSEPDIEQSIADFEAEGLKHLIVTPSAFPASAMHTMWDVAEKATGRAVLPDEGVVVHQRTSGMTVYYTADGFADITAGREAYRDGLEFVARNAVLNALAQADDPLGGEGGDDGDAVNGGDAGNDGDAVNGGDPVNGGNVGTSGDGDNGNDGVNGGDGNIDQTCLQGEICITLTDGEATGSELRLMLYETTTDAWPQQFRSLPTPSWVVTEYPAVPAGYPVRIRIPIDDNLFAISSNPLEGSRFGLAIATGVASIFTVDPTDARGFSDHSILYDPNSAMDFGSMELALPAGEVCDLNPYHPDCLGGGLMWRQHFLGAEDFVPGAVYMAQADVDRDGIDDIITVGEPHFERPDLPLTSLKLGVYYLNDDLTLRDQEIIDQWSETDPALYSPWGLRVIDHGGEPLIIVGTNIPGLAPLEEGSGNVYSYRKVNDIWERSEVQVNAQPTVNNYNAMIVVTCDIDQDGDEDLVLSGAFGTSSVGNWLENTGLAQTPWIPHLLPMYAGTDPYIRGTLAYKCADLNGDSYPEVMYNGMFDIAETDPPRYRGEIWLGVNPGPGGWDDIWQKVVIDDDNWASADMWFHDFNDDGYPDLIANQIFSSTVTQYTNPEGNLADAWSQEVIISGLTSPSDMWLEDMDEDGLMDVFSADHTAHRGVWHKNPGNGSSDPWRENLIFRGIRLPGDFTMSDLDEDGDLDWLGVSMTRGQAFIVEQVQPESSLVARISLPATFEGKITKLMLTLATEVPVTGIPAAILATIDNVDADGDGLLDVDQILSTNKDLVLGVEDVGAIGDFHVIAALYVEGGGEFQPVPGVDYMAGTTKLMLGTGQVDVTLDLALVPSEQP